MSTLELLDPELHQLVEVFPAIPLDADGLPEYRAALEAGIELTDPAAHNLTRQEVWVPCADGPDVRCLLYMPNEGTTGGPRAGYLHIHGGGYILGSPENSDVVNAHLAGDLGIVVLSVDYRLAPEHTIPAPLDDCYAALGWLHQEAATLNVDPTRIGIGGESAGGGLAAALAIHSRDLAEYPICHQHLTFPMLDNLTGSDAQPGDPLVGEFVWTREHNQFGWASYLGDSPATAPQVPARVSTYEGLPPTWMLTATLDLFRDENIFYAQNLMRAGVATELSIYASACHGFQILPDTKMGQRYTLEHAQALARGLGAEVNSG